MNSLESVRQAMRVVRTPQDKGWELTIKIKAYDDGFLSVNDAPMNSDDVAATWLAAARFVQQQIEMLRLDYPAERSNAVAQEA